MSARNESHLRLAVCRDWRLRPSSRKASRSRMLAVPFQQALVAAAPLPPSKFSVNSPGVPLELPNEQDAGEEQQPEKQDGVASEIIRGRARSHAAP